MTNNKADFIPQKYKHKYITLQWRYMNVVASRIAGNTTVCWKADKKENVI